MKLLLQTVLYGAAGFAVVLAAHAMMGLRVDLLTAAVGGGIGIAISVAIELGKQRGHREAEFESERRYDDNG